MCALQTWGLFPQSGGAPAVLSSQMLWSLLLPLPDPQAGNPGVGSEPSLLYIEELVQYNGFPVCGLLLLVGGL